VFVRNTYQLAIPSHIRSAPFQREDTDKWAKEGVEDLMKSFASNAEDEEEDGCNEQWQNMRQDTISRAYGMCNETRFFPALCHHNFVLKVVEMVRSGEL
jgi:hypothetical protein